MEPTRTRKTTSPGLIRQEVLHMHDEVRDVLRRVLQAARTSPPWPPSPALRAALHELGVAVDRLLARERRALKPILPDLDAWGPARADCLREVHDHLRAELARLEAGEVVAPESVRRAIRALLRELRREEHEILAEDVLRDDVVVVDQSGG